MCVWLIACARYAAPASILYDGNLNIIYMIHEYFIYIYIYTHIAHRKYTLYIYLYTRIYKKREMRLVYILGKCDEERIGSSERNAKRYEYEVAAVSNKREGHKH